MPACQQGRQVLHCQEASRYFTASKEPADISLPGVEQILHVEGHQEAGGQAVQPAQPGIARVEHLLEEWKRQGQGGVTAVAGPGTAYATPAWRALGRLRAAVGRTAVRGKTQAAQASALPAPAVLKTRAGSCASQPARNLVAGGAAGTALRWGSPAPAPAACAPAPDGPQRAPRCAPTEGLRPLRAAPGAAPASAPRRRRRRRSGAAARRRRGRRGGSAAP